MTEDPQPTLTPTQKGGAFARVALWFYGPAAVLSIIWAHSQNIDYFQPIRKGDWHFLWQGPLAGLVVVLITWLLSLWTTFQRDLERYLAGALGRPGWADTFVIATLSALGEELFFRGLVQYYWGWIPAALLFGLLHFPSRRRLLPWTVFALSIGAGFGYWMHLTGDLLSPIIAHFTINFINIARLGRQYPPENEQNSLANG